MDHGQDLEGVHINNHSSTAGPCISSSSRRSVDISIKYPFLLPVWRSIRSYASIGEWVESRGQQLQIAIKI